jgi:hypothetical protein
LIAQVFGKLNLPDSPDDHRRVLECSPSSARALRSRLD